MLLMGVGCWVTIDRTRCVAGQRESTVPSVHPTQTYTTSNVTHKVTEKQRIERTHTAARCTSASPDHAMQVIGLDRGPIIALSTGLVALPSSCTEIVSLHTAHSESGWHPTQPTQHTALTAHPRPMVLTVACLAGST